MKNKNKPYSFIDLTTYIKEQCKSILLVYYSLPAFWDFRVGLSTVHEGSCYKIVIMIVKLGDSLLPSLTLFTL